jgi:single-stranded DNA-binding protein
MTPITLIGYLGRDREIRTTRQRTYTARYWNAVAEDWTETEVTPPTRDYALLSLATHHGTNGHRKTSWHRVICWNAQRPEAKGIRIARRGDKVKVTGHREIFSWTDEQGQRRETEQLILTNFQFIEPKARVEAP